MDWAFTEEQEQLGGLVRSIMDREVTEERRRALDASDERFDRDLFGVLRRAGVLDGLGLIERCKVCVELGRAVAAVGVQTLVATSLAGRTDAIVAAAVADEPVDVAGGRLSGSRTTVQGGLVADAFLVPADGRVFLVERSDPGVTVDRQLVTSTEYDAAVTLAGASAVATEIDPDDLVRQLTVAICAHQLGVCERALELTAEYAKQRVQFDRPIATFQAVGQRLADAYIDVQAIRLTLWQAAWRLAEGLDADTEIATAKFWAADAGHRVAHTAVHVHGGMGIDLDYHLHRYFTAAKRNEFALGAATEQLVGIGRTLAEEPA